MTRPLVAFILIAAAVLLFVHNRAETQPLLIDAASRDAKANMLFVPCPLSPRNIPPFEQERKA